MGADEMLMGDEPVNPLERLTGPGRLCLGCQVEAAAGRRALFDRLVEVVQENRHLRRRLRLQGNQSVLDRGPAPAERDPEEESLLDELARKDARIAELEETVRRLNAKLLDRRRSA